LSEWKTDPTTTTFLTDVRVMKEVAGTAPAGDLSSFLGGFGAKRFDSSWSNVSHRLPALNH